MNSSSSDKNLRIWDKLGRTDPAHTKAFNRSGGFKGTAIKPMWCNLRMTEVFGPCGLRWGMTEPKFETREAADEMLVFCTVGLWYIEDDSERAGSASKTIYGVGGDKYLIKQSSGIRASDEAFKAAYTDALSNAMKFIGVAADVHMGLFDDNKYVEQMKREFAGEPEPKPQAPTPRISAKDAEEFRKVASEHYSTDEIKAALKAAGINNSASIPPQQYSAWMEWARNEAEVPA